MRRRTLMVVLATVAAVLAAQALAAIAWVYSGLYDFSATAQHMRTVQWGIDTSLMRSVGRQSGEGRPPYDLSDPELLRLGLVLYAEHCALCHGAPGEAPSAFALGLNPPAPSLVEAGQNWAPHEVYWGVRNGIRMTGMPAWRFRMDERELWAVTAFVKALPAISPADYRATRAAAAAGPTRTQAAERSAPRPGDPERGSIAARQYGCPTCHAVPGLVGAQTQLAPSLRGWRERTYIAGRLPNTPGNLEAWIRNPQAVDPQTAMPDLGVSPQDARDIAAFLYASR